jgi:hypothetical protein
MFDFRLLFRHGQTAEGCPRVRGFRRCWRAQAVSRGAVEDLRKGWRHRRARGRGAVLCGGMPERARGCRISLFHCGGPTLFPQSRASDATNPTPSGWEDVNRSRTGWLAGSRLNDKLRHPRMHPLTDERGDRYDAVIARSVDTEPSLSRLPFRQAPAVFGPLFLGDASAVKTQINGFENAVVGPGGDCARAPSFPKAPGTQRASRDAETVPVVRQADTVAAKETLPQLAQGTATGLARQTCWAAVGAGCEPARRAARDRPPDPSMSPRRFA